MSDDTDLLAELAALPGVEGYSATQRYQDFRQLFTSSEQGKRVLREILSWGHLLQPSIYGTPVDPYLTHMREGEANMARKLLATVYREPPAPPKGQTRKKR